MRQENEELNRNIEELKSKIAGLESERDYLKRQIEELSKRLECSSIPV
jgi:cell division protein FtsL